MAITDEEREHLISYIERRMCHEARRGEECVDRKDQGDLIDGRHPACLEAEEMIEILRRA